MSIISALAETIKLSHQVDKDVRTFFEFHGLSNIAVHSESVVDNIRKLAKQFDIGADLPVIAAYLHDVGLVLPKEQFLPAAIEYGIEILDEEQLFPGLLHQKLSQVIASDVFGIETSSVLNAIGCHTTLKAGASDIEMMLFVADKLTWTDHDSIPIINGIREGLTKSLAHAAFSYINYSMENKEKLQVLHPWMLEAYDDLKQRCM